MDEALRDLAATSRFKWLAEAVADILGGRKTCLGSCRTHKGLLRLCLVQEPSIVASRVLRRKTSQERRLPNRLFDLEAPNLER